MPGEKRIAFLKVWNSLPEIALASEPCAFAMSMRNPVSQNECQGQVNNQGQYAS